MTAAIVSANGEVVIPVEIRRRLGIGSGTEVELIEEGGQIRIVVRRVSTPSRLEEGFGMLRYTGPPRRLADFDVATAMRDEKGSK